MCSQMDLQKNMYRLWRACFTKLKKKAKISSNTLWFITISLLQVPYNHLCRSYKAGGCLIWLAMSNATRKQLGIQPEIIKNIDNHDLSPNHDLYVGQHVMYQDSAIKWWYPAVIESLCPETRSCKIKTNDGALYRKMQAYLMPYTPQNKKSQSTQCVSPPIAESNHMWPVKQFDHKKSSQVNNHSQVHTARPKRDLNPHVNLDL